jgi:hypothetical protein
VVDSKPTDLGGIKSATAFVSGPGAYGQLRWEGGVHRATMVPPNDKAGRMQTGTAVVIALPEVSEVRLRVGWAVGCGCGCGCVCGGGGRGMPSGVPHTACTCPNTRWR